jgi:hypothetical protein
MGIGYAEDKMAEYLGVSRDSLKAFRADLLEGEDWACEGNRIRYSEDGVLRLLDLMGLDLPKKRAKGSAGHSISSLLDCARLSHPTDQDSQKNGAPEVFDLRVVKITSNRKILFASHTAGTFPGSTENNLVRVKVRDNSNFRQDMILQAVWLEEDLWELAGRCPRFRGRW